MEQSLRLFGAFWRMNTPRSCFLMSSHAVPCRSPGTERDANREMRDLGLGDWLVLLIHDASSETIKIPMNANGKTSEMDVAFLSQAK